MSTAHSQPKSVPSSSVDDALSTSESDSHGCSESEIIVARSLRTICARSSSFPEIASSRPRLEPGEDDRDDEIWSGVVQPIAHCRCAAGRGDSS